MLLGERLPGVPVSEGIGQLAHRSNQVDDTESGHRAADVVVGEKLANRRQRLDEIVAIPERRPRDQDQQQSGFEQQCDEQQTSEQGDLAFGLEC